MSIEVFRVDGCDADLCKIAHVSHDGTGFEYDGDDERLINHLMKKGHLSIFEFCSIALVLEAPIWLVRQFMRYRHSSYNERSLRYCEPIDSAGWMIDGSYSQVEYKVLRSEGVKRQDARKVLPLDTLTRVVVQRNILSWFHFLEQRLHKSAQKEIRDLAKEIELVVEENFPITYDAWCDYRKGGRWVGGEELARLRNG